MWKLLLFLPLAMYTWGDLHSAQSVDEFLDLVYYFRTAFPCEECRQDFDHLVENHPYPVSEVNDVTEMRVWSWLTHNMVNSKIGKPWQPLSVLKSSTL